MTNEDRAAFKELMFAMAAAYGKEVDEPMTTGYWLLLFDLPVERVKAAILEAMRTSDFFPTAAAIRKIAQREIDRQELDRKISERRRQHAAAVALDVVQHCRRIGWDDARAAAELVRVGQEVGFELTWPAAIRRKRNGQTD